MAWRSVRSANRGFIRESGNAIGMTETVTDGGGDMPPAAGTSLILSPAPSLLPAPLFAPNPKAAKRVVEFFATQISNDHTRRAYINATRRFAAWCARNAIGQLVDVQPIDVAAVVKELGHKDGDDLSPPTVKQQLAAVRMLFDWLVTGHVLDVNPAHAVLGAKYVVKRGKTPVLDAKDARQLLDTIKITTSRKLPDGTTREEPHIIGLRDRALIGVMVYSFARINAALQMKVADYFVQGRHGWVRVHEKGGKEHEVPCHHNLEKYLDAYIAAVGIADDQDGPLFRTSGRKTGKPHSMSQKEAHAMIQRRARRARIKMKIGNHTFRATGITAYMSNGGSLKHAQQMANHPSPRTTKLYDRRNDVISLDEVERIVI